MRRFLYKITTTKEKSSDLIFLPEGRETILDPGQSFSLSLCGPISISRANANMVHKG